MRNELSDNGYQIEKRLRQWDDYKELPKAPNGKRRTNADKRNAVEMLLKDEEWQKKSNGWIAGKCAVSDFLVRDGREALAAARPTRWT